MSALGRLALAAKRMRKGCAASSLFDLLLLQLKTLMAEENTADGAVRCSLVARWCQGVALTVH
jgi:hypothetical protein